MYRPLISRIIRSLLAVALLAITAFGGTVAAADSAHAGAVYALTNAATGNAVVVWNRAPDGTLSPAGSYATGGLGTAAGLGSQGAVVLSDKHRLLFAVNPGSNDISSFQVDGDSLTLVGRVPSGGTTPTSLTLHDRRLYVLNAGGAGNISGFKIAHNGTLTPLANSTRALSGGATAPAQVQFSPDGDFLAVTERASQNIDIYPVDKHGQAGALVVSRSSGAVPFGFAFDKRGRLVVSEAGGGQNGLSAASSYRIDDNGSLVVITGSAATNQGAACWVVITKNGRFAYTANAAAGSNSISGFAIGKNGSLTLITPDGRTGVAGNGPTDMALSVNSQFLYVRNARDNSISAFAVQANGTLQALPGAAGLPAGAAGLAAF